MVNAEQRPNTLAATSAALTALRQRKGSLVLRHGLLLAGLATVTFVPLRAPGFFFTLSDALLLAYAVQRVLSNRIQPLPFGKIGPLYTVGCILLVAGLVLSSLVNNRPVAGFTVTSQYLYSFLLVPLVLTGLPFRVLVLALKAFLLGLTITCVTGLVLYGLPSFSVAHATTGRLYSFLGNPNTLAGVLSLSIAGLVLLYFTRLLTTRTFVVVLGIFLTTIAFSASFGGLLTALLSLVCLGGLTFDRRLVSQALPSFLTIGLFVVLIFGVPAVFAERILGALFAGDSGSAGSLDLRLVLTQQALDLIESRPWVGIGLDHMVEITGYDEPVHNTYLLLWVEAGILAIAGWCLILGFHGWLGVRLFLRRTTHKVGACLLAGLLAFAFQALGHAHLYARYWYIPLVLLAFAAVRAPRRLVAPSAPSASGLAFAPLGGTERPAGAAERASARPRARNPFADIDLDIAGGAENAPDYVDDVDLEAERKASRERLRRRLSDALRRNDVGGRVARSAEPREDAPDDAAFAPREDGRHGLAEWTSRVPLALPPALLDRLGDPGRPPQPAGSSSPLDVVARTAAGLKETLLTRPGLAFKPVRSGDAPKPAPAPAGPALGPRGRDRNGPLGLGTARRPDLLALLGRASAGAERLDAWLRTHMDPPALAEPEARQPAPADEARAAVLALPPPSAPPPAVSELHFPPPVAAPPPARQEEQAAPVPAELPTVVFKPAPQTEPAPPAQPIPKPAREPAAPEPAPEPALEPAAPPVAMPKPEEPVAKAPEASPLPPFLAPRPAARPQPGAKPTKAAPVSLPARLWSRFVAQFDLPDAEPAPARPAAAGSPPARPAEPMLPAGPRSEAPLGDSASSGHPSSTATPTPPLSPVAEPPAPSRGPEPEAFDELPGALFERHPQPDHQPSPPPASQEVRSAPVPPPQPWLAAEEAPLAYLVLTHQDPRHLGRLLRRLDHGAHFYVHVDARADLRPFREATRGLPVTFMDERLPVVGGGISQVQATLALLYNVIRRGEPYRKFVFLSGACYPIKPAWHLLDILAAEPSESHVLLYDGRHQPALEANHPLSHLQGITPWYGSGFPALGRLAAQLVLDTIEAEPKVLDLWAAAEDAAHQVIPTLLGHSEHITPANLLPGPALPDHVERSLAALHMVAPAGGYFTLADLDDIELSEKLFMRKVSSKYSEPLLEQIDQRILGVG